MGTEFSVTEPAAGLSISPRDRSPRSGNRYSIPGETSHAPRFTHTQFQLTLSRKKPGKPEDSGVATAFTLPEVEKISHPDPAYPAQRLVRRNQFTPELAWLPLRALSTPAAFPFKGEAFLAPASTCTLQAAHSGARLISISIRPYRPCHFRTADR
jgi:hypothetical protein